MNLRTLLLPLLLAMTLGLLTVAHADLAAYLKKPEPVYKWSLQGTRKDARNGVTIYDLHLVSQTWQDLVWEHRLQVFVPDGVKHPHFCALLNTGGDGGAAESQLGALAAKNSNAMFAILFGIPKQPLYGGKTEDALVVYTWQKFLETGDESWPLHFPMAKSVIKAMDAIQEFAKQQKLPSVDDFLITGASKRGWTTWLAGASRDKRIKGIAPMVIDTLNVAAQIPHQLAAFGGKPSEQVDDYTKADMFNALRTPQGQRLLQLEDPYSYREILTLPKLIILGTNDRYWAQDALNIYWDGLKGPKWVSYTPNSGHGLEDRVHVFTTLSAFTEALATNTAWPKMKWEYKDASSGADLFVGSDIKPKAARLFRAYAKTQDFRDSKWTSEPMSATEGGFQGHLDTPVDGYAAIFGEVVYEINDHTFTLSTQIKILGKSSTASTK